MFLDLKVTTTKKTKKRKRK